MKRPSAADLRLAGFGLTGGGRRGKGGTAAQWQVLFWEDPDADLLGQPALVKDKMLNHTAQTVAHVA